MIRSICVVGLAFAFILVVGFPLLLFTVLTGNSDVIYRAGVFGARLTVKLAGVQLEVRGRDKIPGSRAVVFMANHQSNCDPPAVIGLLPPVLILVKEEFFRVPVLGRAMRQRGFIAVDRRQREKSIRSLDRAAEALRAGHSFLVFPEGTRSADGRLLPFKKGVFIMALKAAVPIVPVSISGSAKIMPKGRAWVRPGRVRITFHEPIATSGFSLHDVGELQAATRQSILEGLDPQEWPLGKPEDPIVKQREIGAVQLLISGRVQGVGFRYFSQREAVALGLRGYVKNLQDGRVEVYAAGDRSALREFKRLLAEGPRGAWVKRVDVTDVEVDSRYTHFTIEA